MKYKVATISILVLAFLLKGVITLLLIADAMAVQEMSATKSVNLVLASESFPQMAPGVPTPAFAALPLVTRPQARWDQAEVPQRCHALPTPDQQSALPQLDTNLLRSATQGTSDISGLEAILVGIVFLSITSSAVFQRGRRWHLRGIVPELIVPPG